jgi:hypothetical protein
LQENRLFFAAKKGNMVYFTGKTIKGETVFIFFVFNGGGHVQIGVKFIDLGV